MPIAIGTTATVPSDLAWKGTIQQKQEAKIEQQEKAELAGCTALKIYDDIHKTTTYFLEKDGHRKSYDETKLSGDLATLAAKYHLEVVELTPTEWTKRGNDYQKSGKDYLSDSDETISGLGVYSTGQEVIGDMQESGVWDAMWGVGLTASAIRNATTWQGKNVSGGKLTIETTTNSKIPTTYKPNTVIKRVDKNGNLISERIFDDSGRVIKDIHHTDHGNPKMHSKVPHKHIWDWSDPKKPRPSK